MSSLTGGAGTVMRTWEGPGQRDRGGFGPTRGGGGAGTAARRRMRPEARAAGRGTRVPRRARMRVQARGRAVPGALLPAGWRVKVARGPPRALGARNPQIIAGETVTGGNRARPDASHAVCPDGDVTVSRRPRRTRRERAPRSRRLVARVPPADAVAPRYACGRVARGVRAGLARVARARLGAACRPCPASRCGRSTLRVRVRGSGRARGVGPGRALVPGGRRDGRA